MTEHRHPREIAAEIRAGKTDKERLDWLVDSESLCLCEWNPEAGQYEALPTGIHVRDTIDAAMKASDWRPLPAPPEED